MTLLLIHSFISEVKPHVLSHFRIHLLLLHFVLKLESLDLLPFLKFGLISVRTF